MEYNPIVRREFPRSPKMTLTSRNRLQLRLESPTMEQAVTGIRGVLEQHAGGVLPEWDLVASTIAVERREARQVVSRPGWLTFIIRGECKLVSYDDAGTETVEQFLSVSDIVAATISPERLVAGELPLSLSRWRGVGQSIPEMHLISLTDVEVLHLDARVATSLAHKYVAWSRVYVMLLWTYVDTMWSIVLAARHTSAADRYAELMSRAHPPRHATQAEIASFLGVTRPALNRILQKSKNSPDGERPTRFPE